MPASSFKLHRPRVSRLLGSRSPSPDLSSAGPRNEAPRLGLDPSRASSSRAPSTPRVPERRANTAITDTSDTPASGNVVYNEDDLGGKLWPAPPAGTQKGTARSVNPHRSATKHSTDTFQSSHSLVPLPTPYPPAAPSQCFLEFLRPIEPSSQYPPQLQHRNQGMFNEAHDFTVTGTFIDAGNVNVNTSNQFMEKLLKETIPGAEFDSSDRDPPPRCLPGTRLAILDRCLSFIHSCDGQRKIRWVVGAAGVGKSAVMQSVAESRELPEGCHASVFFSVNGRNDGTKAVITISYQFAAKSEPYYQLIEKVITRDPSLLRASMAKQFLKLITEPFINNPQLNSAGRVLIILDGLDECKDRRTQLELLRLITDHCITYPSSPLVWLIASRPEAHITSFFAKANIIPAYEKEEIVVDSDSGRADIERFLRSKLTEIKDASDSLGPHWPGERQFWILADASGGLFAYAQTVMRYIGDLTIGSPSSQLSDVLHVIDNHPLTGISPEEHPMALLDALYARILSNIPPRIMINTRKILLALVSDWDPTKGNLNVLCNWLGLTCDEAYAAINHLRAVLYVPRREDAYREKLGAFHKSFIDFICDFTRSGFSRHTKREAQQLINECAFRVLNEAPDGIDFGDVDYEMFYGRLVRDPGTGNNISLTWPADNVGVGWDDNRTRLCLYELAIVEVIAGLGRKDEAFQSEFCICLLKSRFQSNYVHFPHYELRDIVFYEDESWRHELSEHGILKLMPAKDIDISQTIHEVKLRFRRSATIETNATDPWNSSCGHKREGMWEEGKDQAWVTVFAADTKYLPFCTRCSQRLAHQLRSWSPGLPDRTASTLFTSAGEHCVEFQFVDPEDGMSEWTYWFWIGPPVIGGGTEDEEVEDEETEDEETEDEEVEDDEEMEDEETEDEETEDEEVEDEEA